MQDFRRLRVTSGVREAIRDMYAFTVRLPRSEQFGISSQLRRATVSIGLNIAEGCSRATIKEYVRYLEIARGSGMEAEFALLVTEDLAMGDPALREVARESLLSVLRQLSALIGALRKRQSRQPPQ